VNVKESFYGPSSSRAGRTGCPIAPPSPTCYTIKVKAAAITDLEIGYQVLEPVKLTLGANNLFNTYPSRISGLLRDDYFRNNSSTFVSQYPVFSPFGINGGYYYGKLTLTF